MGHNCKFEMGTTDVLGRGSPLRNAGAMEERVSTMKLEQNSDRQWPRNEAEQKGPGEPGATSTMVSPYSPWPLPSHIGKSTGVTVTSEEPSVFGEGLCKGTRASMSFLI